MRRLLLSAVVALVVGASAYVGAFYATRTVLGHGADCGPPPLYECGTYYAAQHGDWWSSTGYSHGIAGSIKFQDVAMIDPNQDTIAHWLTMGAGLSAEQAQMGFVEGLSPDNVIRSSPTLYTERIVNPACQDYRFQPISPQYNPDYPEIRWSGISWQCGGRMTYWYYMCRQGSTCFELAKLPASLNNFQAGTEHINTTHMEPNGTQCFGTYSDCASQHGLWLYNRNTGYWTQWDMSRATIVLENQGNAGYYRNPIIQWTSFTTTRW